MVVLGTKQAQCAFEQGNYMKWHKIDIDDDDVMQHLKELADPVQDKYGRQLSLTADQFDRL